MFSLSDFGRFNSGTGPPLLLPPSEKNDAEPAEAAEKGDASNDASDDHVDAEDDAPSADELSPRGKDRRGKEFMPL